MRTLWAIQLTALLSIAMGASAAEVHYQHPNLTIVAKDETLDSVLKSVSKAMQIVVKTPTGLNPVISCEIRNLPIKLAFKKLLGEMSYSMAWQDDGERLLGLTVLAGTTDSVASAATGESANSPVDDPAVDAGQQAREAEMELQRQEEVMAHEARMEEQAMQNEADMAEYFQSQGIDPGQ
jgi:hypothetical protein